MSSAESTTDLDELVASVIHDGEVSPDQRERLEAFLKKPFQSPKDRATGEFVDDEFGYFVGAAAEFAEYLHIQHREFLRQQYVNTAVQQGLDELGYFVGIYRETGELDDSYRARIKAGFRGLLGGATMEQVIEITAQLLACSPDKIDITEPFTRDSARIDITIPETVLEDAAVSETAMIELVYMYRAAGVEITLAVGDVFTYRSLEDYYNDVNDPDQAYGNAPYRSNPRTSD